MIFVIEILDKVADDDRRMLLNCRIVGDLFDISPTTSPCGARFELGQHRSMVATANMQYVLQLPIVQHQLSILFGFSKEFVDCIGMAAIQEPIQ